MIDRDKTPQEAPASVPVTDTAAASAAGPQTPAAPVKNKGGAPRGNTNGLVHGAYAARAAEKQRDRHVREAQRAVQEILAEHGLKASATWRAWGREVVTLMKMRGRIIAFADRRGYFDKNGNMRPSVKEAMDRVETLLAEFRKLIDAAPPAPVVPPAGGVVYRAVYGGPDGTVAPRFAPPACDVPEEAPLPEGTAPDAAACDVAVPAAGPHVPDTVRALVGVLGPGLAPGIKEWLRGDDLED